MIPLYSRVIRCSGEKKNLCPHILHISIKFYFSPWFSVIRSPQCLKALGTNNSSVAYFLILEHAKESNCIGDSEIHFEKISVLEFKLVFIILTILEIRNSLNLLLFHTKPRSVRLISEIRSRSLPALFWKMTMILVLTQPILTFVFPSKYLSVVIIKARLIAEKHFTDFLSILKMILVDTSFF